MNRNDALKGALVADAAAMGLHWLYDQDQIAMVEATGDLLFRQPDPAVYRDKRGAFVHAARRAGELSHYGESACIVGALGSAYTTTQHRQDFLRVFGPCGSFHGYADRPTKSLIARMLLEDDELEDPSGMDDNQMPALCAVPGLFAAKASKSQVLDAVSVVSTHDEVHVAAGALFDALSELASGSPLQTVLSTTAEQTPGDIGDALKNALTLNPQEPQQVAERLGLACYAKHALPLTWYLLYRAISFESVVRDNIRCGGDSCGRAMALGSLAGLAFGVPDALSQRVTLRSESAQL